MSSEIWVDKIGEIKKLITQKKECEDKIKDKENVLDNLSARKKDFERNLAEYDVIEKKIISLFSKKVREEKNTLQSQLLGTTKEIEKISEEIKRLHQERETIEKRLKDFPKVISPSDIIDLHNLTPDAFDSLRREFRFFGKAAFKACAISLQRDYFSHCSNADILAKKFIDSLESYKEYLLKNFNELQREIEGKGMTPETQEIDLSPLLKIIICHLSAEDEYTEKNFQMFYNCVNAFLKDLIICEETLDPNNISLILDKNLLEELKDILKKFNYECRIWVDWMPFFGFYHNVLIMDVKAKERREENFIGIPLVYEILEYEVVGKCLFGRTCFWDEETSRIYLDISFFNPEIVFAGLFNRERLKTVYHNMPPEELKSKIRESILIHEKGHAIFKKIAVFTDKNQEYFYSELFSRILTLFLTPLLKFEICAFDMMPQTNSTYTMVYHWLKKRFSEHLGRFSHFEELLEKDDKELRELSKKILKSVLRELKRNSSSSAEPFFIEMNNLLNAYC